MILKTILKEIRLVKKEVRLIKKEIVKRNLYRKRYLTISQASLVVGVSKSFIQKLVSSKQIPHSKPNGKLVFIHRKDLEEFLSQNHISSNEEIESKVADYLLNKKSNK